MRGIRLFRGDGHGRFVDVEPPSWSDESNATAVVAFDYDADSDLDVFVGVDGGPSVLYRNDGDFMFTDIAASAGVDLKGVRVFAGRCRGHRRGWSCRSVCWRLERQRTGPWRRDISQRVTTECGGWNLC